MKAISCFDCSLKDTMFKHSVNYTPNDNSEQEVPVPELANIELEEPLLPGPVEGPSCTILKRKKKTQNIHTIK